MHFKQAIAQQMAGNEEWQIGASGAVDNGMRKGNRRLVLLECGCAVRLVQEPIMMDNPRVMMWSTHVIVVTKVMIQIFERVL